jgi:hypothetical protein
VLLAGEYGFYELDTKGNGMRINRLFSGIAAVQLLFLIEIMLPAISLAEINKCLGPNGELYFTDRVCPDRYKKEGAPPTSADSLSSLGISLFGLSGGMTVDQVRAITPLSDPHESIDGSVSMSATLRAEGTEFYAEIYFIDGLYNQLRATYDCKAFESLVTARDKQFGKGDCGTTGRDCHWEKNGDKLSLNALRSACDLHIKGRNWDTLLAEKGREKKSK